MIGPLVVLRQSLADFGCGHPHHWVLSGVVVRVSGEDFLADRSLLQRLGGGQRVLDGVAQERRKSLAVAKERAGDNAAEFLTDGFPFGFGRRPPRRRRAGRRISLEVLAHAPILARVSIRPVVAALGVFWASESKRGRISTFTDSISVGGRHASHDAS